MVAHQRGVNEGDPPHRLADRRKASLHPLVGTGLVTTGDITDGLA